MLSNVIYLDLSFNHLNGTLPEEFGYNFTSVRQLYLDHNKFNGTIPESYTLAGNGSLLALDLSYNMLNGGLPTTWTTDNKNKDVTGTPPSINTINVKNNSLTEGVDNNICKMSVANDGGTLVQLSADCGICWCNDFCNECWGN